MSKWASVAASAWVRAAMIGLLLGTVCGYARADSDLDLSGLKGGTHVAPLAEWYRDVSTQHTFEEIAAPRFAHHFVRTRGELALGLEQAPVWLRFRAINREGTRKSWFLELGYPHLDYVSLFVVRAHGAVERVETGDMLPFSARPVAQPHFIFPMESQPGETLEVYLRVSTTGTISLPLTAWDATEFLESQGRTSAALWMFFGALLMMALYNCAVFVLIRQVEYLTQALLLVAMCASTFTFNGLMFQYFFPTNPSFANKAIGFFLMLAISSGMLTCSQVSARVEEYQVYAIGFKRAAWTALGCAACVAVSPKEFGLRMAVIGTMAGAVGGVGTLLLLTRHNHPQLRLYLLSWYCPLLGVPVTVLVNLGVIPPSPLTSWAAHIGCAMQAVFTSLALAARVKVMGDHLAGLNTQLSHNVLSLERALDSAKDANAAAVRATRAKDEFLATMSHELRTPLNAIINVPQGLLDDFEERSAVTCTHCRTEFVLDSGDHVDASTRCEECQTQGTMLLGKQTVYVGEPAHTARFLRKIERAGHHLLHMVDGVLDFSKMEVGRLELHWSNVDLGLIVGDVVDAMSELARQKGLTLHVALPECSLLRMADPIRLKQVLLNLLSNAIKFSDDAGRIEVVVDWEPATESDIVSVRDAGIGIAAEHHERIFAGFEQVHTGSNRKYGGTGLGLPISRSLVRMHGGELWVESTLGQGSAFVLRLPRRAAPAGMVYPATASLYPSLPAVRSMAD